MPPSKRRPRNQPAASSPASKPQWGLLVVGLLVGAVGMRVWDAKQALPPPGPAPAPNDVVIDNNKPTPKPDGGGEKIELKDSWLVVVIARKSVPVKYQMVLDDDEFWQSKLKSLGMRVAVYDPASDEGKKYVPLINIPPPFIAHELPNGKIRKAIPFPENDVTAIEAMLK